MARQTFPWKTVWITGASSGIGEDMAVKLAEAGVNVAASARSSDKLERLAARNAMILPVPADVTDLDSVSAAIKTIHEQLGAIDLAILNAGVWQPVSGRHFEVAKVLHSMDVNYSGIARSLDAVLPDMIDRDHGHVALVSSVAGYRGLPKSLAYSPSKSAVISMAECLRLDLSRTKIDVSIINPGFIDTPMTQVNDFPMPFIITSDDAANRILSGLKKRKYEIIFPWQMSLLMKAARITPDWLFFRIARTFMMPARKD